MVSGAAIQGPQLQAYTGHAAKLQGHLEIYLKTLQGFVGQFPANDALATQIRPEVLNGLDSLTALAGSPAKITGITVGHIYPEEYMEQGVPSKQANVTWQADITDAGKLMDHMQSRGIELTEMIENRIVGAGTGWTQFVEVEDYWVIDYTITDPTGIVTGGLVRQKTGHKHGAMLSSVGSAPAQLQSPR
jgi:hypothetical protein